MLVALGPSDGSGDLSQPCVREVPNAYLASNVVVLGNNDMERMWKEAFVR